MFFVIHCWNLLGLLKGKSSILMTNDLFGIELLTKLSHLRLATFMSTNLDAVLKIHEIHLVPVVLKLKPQHTISRAVISINETESLLRKTWKNITIFFFRVSDNNLISLPLYGDDEFDGTKN